MISFTPILTSAKVRILSNCECQLESRNTDPTELVTLFPQNLPVVSNAFSVYLDGRQKRCMRLQAEVESVLDPEQIFDRLQ
jgi:hypothetical protein